MESKKEIPQADDVNKISEFPLRVFEGYDTADKIKHVFGFVNRQSSYYRQASEILGLVSRDNHEELVEIQSKKQAMKSDASICIALLLVVSINYTIKSRFALNYL